MQFMYEEFPPENKGKRILCFSCGKIAAGTLTGEVGFPVVNGVPYRLVTSSRYVCMEEACAKKAEAEARSDVSRDIKCVAN